MKSEKYIIKIDDIEQDKSLNFTFEDYIDGIKSKKPIKADLTFKMLQNMIEVTGKIKGVAQIECDLCLEEYDYKLDIDINELYDKGNFIQSDEEIGKEIELKEGQFITDLAGAREIDIMDLLYQSVILDFPNKKVCGINCKGDIFSNEENYSNSQLDPRMEIFKNIKIDK